MQRKHLLLVALVMVLALLVFPLACAPSEVDEPEDPTEGPPDPEEPEVGVGGSVTMAIRNHDYDTLDPHISRFTQSHIVFMNMFDPFIWLGPDGEYYPGLAREWEMEDEGRIWNLHLREDVVFHDGTPFNAEAAKISFDRIVDPATGSVGAVDRMGSYRESEVVDDYTIRVYFDEPTPNWMYDLTGHWITAVSPTALEEYGSDEFENHLVGTGPFKLKEEVFQTQVTLERNPDYNWGPDFMENQGSPHLDELIFRFIHEDETRFSALETGEVQIIDEVSPAQVQTLQDSADFDVEIIPRLGIARGYHIDTTMEPMDDIRVRKAFIKAIDVDLICETVLEGVYPPAHSVLVEGTLFYDPDTEIYDFNPEKAREHLDDAGWVEGDDGYRYKDGERLEIRMGTFPGFVSEAPAEFVDSMLRDVGMAFSIEVLDGGPFMSTFSDPEANPWHVGHIGTYDVDPIIPLYRFYHSEQIGGSNYSRLQSDEVDDLLNRAMATTDLNEKEELIKEIQMIVMEQALVRPVYGNVSMFGYSTVDFEGLNYDLRGFGLFNSVKDLRNQ